MTNSTKHLKAWVRQRDSRLYAEYGIRNDIWTFQYDADPIANATNLGSYLRMDFYLDLLAEDQILMLPGIARQFFADVTQAGELSCGLCDIADVYETFCGRLYSATEILAVNFQRQLSRELWIRAGESRARKAQGVFWGNFLGPQMIEILGGAESFQNEYRAMEDDRDRELCTMFDDGSLLLTLSSDVSDMIYPYTGLMPSAIERAAWLYERLCKAGLMCGL